MEGDDVCELLRRAQAGDHDAMARLLDLLEPTMRHVARGFADPYRPDESVSDLLQEAKLRTWQRIGQFEGPSSARKKATPDAPLPTGDRSIVDEPSREETAAVLRGWVARLVRRIGLNHIEARAARKRRSPERALVRLGGGGGSSAGHPSARESQITASDPSASEEARRREREELIRGALDALDDGEGRALVESCFFDGLSLRAAAMRLGVPYPRARERYHDTLRRLERLLRGRL